MIDLHLHTTYSDGTDTVEELLENAEKSKLEIISITDHNSLGAYFELERNPEIRKKFSGEIIIGSEIKTIFDDVNIEILAYGVDYKKLVIKKEDQQQVQNEALKHFIEVGKKLGLKCDENIKVDINNRDKLFGTWVYYDEIEKYPENKEILDNIIKSSKLTFYRDHEGNKNSPFYYNTSIYYDDCDTLIKKIHDAGGIAILAHGLIYSFDDNKAAVEKILSTTEIDGAECIYPLFDEEQRKFMIDLCKKYNKFISGGSDYHAKTKPNTMIGTGINNNICVEKEHIKDWVDKVRKI